MTLIDIEVAARLQASVLRFIIDGIPDEAEFWPKFELRAEHIAVFDRPFRLGRVDAGERFSLWSDLSDRAGRSGRDDKEKRAAVAG